MPQGRVEIIDFSTSRQNEGKLIFHTTALACSNPRTVDLYPANYLVDCLLIVSIFSAKPSNKRALYTLHCKFGFC